jgi:hypothetical protein
MALPPEYVDRLIGGQSGYTTAEFDFQSRLLLFCQPTFGFLYPLGSQPNPVLMQRTRRWADLYKDFVRPFMNTGRIYHHTPEVAGLDPHGWGVLELASNDRTRGVCGIFNCQPQGNRSISCGCADSMSHAAIGYGHLTFQTDLRVDGFYVNEAWGYHSAT